MIGLGSSAKWVAIAIIILSIGYGVNKIHSIHLDIVKEAKIQAVKDFAATLEDKIVEKEIIIKDLSEEQRKIIEAELQLERDKVAKLRQELANKEDFRKKLQEQPEEFIRNLNAETSEFYKELGEITQ